MSIKIEIQQREECLWVVAAGAWQVDEVEGLIDRVADEVRSRGLSRVLVDMREVRGDPSNMDRLRIGEHAAESLGSRIRVAAICRDEVINWFAESVAVRSGADVKVFSIESDAEEWVGA